MDGEALCLLGSEELKELGCSMVQRVKLAKAIKSLAEDEEKSVKRQQQEAEQLKPSSFFLEKGKPKEGTPFSKVW